MKFLRLALAVLSLGLVLWLKTQLDHLRAQWGSFQALSDPLPGPVDKIGSIGTGQKLDTPAGLDADALGIEIADGSGTGNDHDEANASQSVSSPGNDHRVIVVGKMKDDDTDWVIDELPDWQHAIYTVDDPGALLAVPRNKGRESNVYLQYIIDNYHYLPALLVFLHSHRAGFPRAWHSEFADHSNIRAVRMLQTDFVRRTGYANLRCAHGPGCPDEVQPFRPPDPARPQEPAFPSAWRAMFNNSDVPEVIATPCCAQFAVSRDQVWMHPLSSYLRFQRWLMETELDDDASGRVMEYMWHIIFGRDPVYCPPVEQCYRDVYGVEMR